MIDHSTDYRRTKRLWWEPSYVDPEEVYPPSASDGIHCKDWDRWDDPFQITFRQYVEVQSKKDQGYHPVREAFDRYGGCDRIDERWAQGAKVLYPILLTGEYGANRVHARVSRYAPAPALRSASFYQSFDELRHAQNHVYQLRMLNKHSDGYNNWAAWRRRHFLLQPARAYFEDFVASPNVFESVVGLNFLTEVAFTNLIFVGVPSVAVLNGDTAMAAELLTTQSDETRHMAIGQSTMRTLLEADERNLEPLQYWFDKHFWIGCRVLACVASLLTDYFATNKAISMKAMFKRYIVDNFVNGLVEDFGKYGFQPPRFLDHAVRDMEDASHSLFRTAYQYKHVLFNKVFVPNQRDLDFFARDYPHFEERHGAFWQAVGEGDPKDLPSLPMFCQVCQLPCVFPTPDNPDIRCSERNGEAYWFCGEACKWIFDHEPVRYSKAVTVDKRLTGKEVDEIRDYFGLQGKLGGVLEEAPI